MQTKSVSQPTNNLISEINPKLENKLKDPLSNKHSGQELEIISFRQISKEETLQNHQERLSITKNQSWASFKLMNQSNTGIRSPPQASEANMGEKR
jgi:hypothetical protein